MITSSIIPLLFRDGLVQIAQSLLKFQISRSDIPVWLNLRFGSLPKTCDFVHPLSVAMSDFSSANEGLNYNNIEKEDDNNKENKEKQQQCTKNMC
jgi:hypothetical protein